MKKYFVQENDYYAFQALKSEASPRVGLVLGLVKTISRESIQICVKVLWNCYQMIIFIIICFWIIAIYLSFISFHKQKVSKKYTKLVVKACSVLSCPAFVWVPFVFLDKVKLSLFTREFISPENVNKTYFDSLKLLSHCNFEAITL